MVVGRDMMLVGVFVVESVLLLLICSMILFWLLNVNVLCQGGVLYSERNVEMRSARLSDDKGKIEWWRVDW